MNEKSQRLLKFQHEFQPSNSHCRIYLIGEMEVWALTAPFSFLISVLSHLFHQPSNQNGSCPIYFMKVSLTFPALLFCFSFEILWYYIWYRR